MTRLKAAVLAAALAGAVTLHAQTSSGSKASFKLGTFEQGGRTFVGVVVDDAIVIDVERANTAFEQGTAGVPRLALAGDMKALIASYDQAVEGRLSAIAAQAKAQPRPPYVMDLQAVRIRPPVAPSTILNAAVNYVEHAKEMGAMATGAAGDEPRSIPGLWERKPGDTRHNPYFFLKPPAVVIASGEAIRLPPGRDRIDWECELSVVVGRTARAVPVERVADYIFGYTLQNDVSDRGGRGDSRHGSDWLIGKGHDTFAPLGPFIVPKAFVPDPQKMPITFTLSGKVMQDSNTERMTHTVFEMLSFGSHILTLHPGDILAMGSPAGVGAARGVFFKPGDTSVCTIGDIGTLTNPVVGASSTPGAVR